jgi:hypothetical protein
MALRAPALDVWRLLLRVVQRGMEDRIDRAVAVRRSRPRGIDIGRRVDAHCWHTLGAAMLSMLPRAVPRRSKG